MCIGDIQFLHLNENFHQILLYCRDLGSYKKLMEVFPKGKMIPENRLQADFFHYPKQQQCATSLLQKMEKNKVIPDEEMGDIILNVFGKYATPYKRYCRMMYWLPKFKNLCPWPLPEEMPQDGLELGKLAIKQVLNSLIKIISNSGQKMNFRSPVWIQLQGWTYWTPPTSQILMTRLGNLGFGVVNIDLKLADLGGLRSEFRSAKLDRGVEERYSSLCGRSFQSLAQGKSGLRTEGLPYIHHILFRFLTSS